MSSWCGTRGTRPIRSRGFVSRTPRPCPARSTGPSSSRWCIVSLRGGVDRRGGGLRVLTRDGRLLFLTRITRLFAYGSLSVVLVFYLTGLGLSASQSGLLLTLTLAGDTVVSLYLTTRADRVGRRRMLIIGAALMVAAGLIFAYTRNFLFLILAGTIGVISPSGNEVGPFLSIEQAALSQVVPARSRTTVFAWYTLAGSFATAARSLGGGVLADPLQDAAQGTRRGRERGGERETREHGGSRSGEHTPELP